MKGASFIKTFPFRSLIDKKKFDPKTPKNFNNMRLSPTILAEQKRVGFLIK